MSNGPECGTHSRTPLTWPEFAATLLVVSKSENFAARLHVDLRRQASAICAVGRRTR
ncbi:putative leader peptide [Streptomyces tritici]|uniref:putative leader peptide n=1 Tax=Streptomyces tritici TaxID=2054410 RepID=UPI003AF1D87E